jgi:large subunit ribosomal protein L15
MQLNNLKPVHKNRKIKRVGRGGKLGTYSGKGLKGQTSRSGRRYKPIMRGLIKRYPKLRGHKFNRRSDRFGFVVLNLDVLEKMTVVNGDITPEMLLEKKLIGRVKGVTPKVKILGKGSVSKSLNFKNCAVSKSAKEKIEKAGGTIK